MSCPDAPTATIVSSAIAASRTKAWATRSVFKRMVPPYFPFSLVCISQETLARSRCPVGPAWRLPQLLSGRRAALFACDVVSQTAKRRTTPLLQDARNHRKFQQQDRVSVRASVYRPALHGVLCSQSKSQL